MKSLYAFLILVALAGNAAAGDAKKTDAGKPPPPVGATGWDTTALKTGEQLAAKLRTAGIPCAEYGPAPRGAFDADYQKHLPMAAAIATCTSEDDEDLTFEVFKDATAAKAFVDAKQELLCRRLQEKDNDLAKSFPGFPYVDGGAWIVETNEKALADKLAPIVGGTSQQRACPK